jgi:hypothetical protein
MGLETRYAIEFEDASMANGMLSKSCGQTAVRGRGSTVYFPRVRADAAKDDMTI